MGSVGVAGPGPQEVNGLLVQIRAAKASKYCVRPGERRFYGLRHCGQKPGLVGPVTGGGKLRQRALWFIPVLFCPDGVGDAKRGRRTNEIPVQGTGLPGINGQACLRCFIRLIESEN
jgi:hypothetical protein